MGHADRHRHQARRRADDFALAPGVVAGFERQVALGGSDGTVVHRDAGTRAVLDLALDGDAGVAYADSRSACAGLNHAGIDGVVFILRHIALMGCHRHTAAFHRGIHDGNIAHFVQVEHHVGHVNGHRAC